MNERDLPLILSYNLQIHNMYIWKYITAKKKRKKTTFYRYGFFNAVQAVTVLNAFCFSALNLMNEAGFLPVNLHVYIFGI